MLSARSLRLLFPLCCLFALSPALFAQKLTVGKITFVGYPAASDTELLAASGLKPGGSFDQPEIQAAAQKLSDTGLFGDVRFALDGSNLTFTLTPAEGAVPVQFVNFPWWDRKTLITALAARV